MFAPSKQSRSTHHGHVVGISTGFQQQPHTHQVFLLAGKCKSCFSILSLVKASPRFRLSKYLCFCMHSLLHLMTAIIVQLHNTNKMQQKATKRTSCKGPQMVPACAGSHQRQMFTPSCEVYAFLHHIALSCIVYTGLHESTRRGQSSSKVCSTVYTAQVSMSTNLRCMALMTVRYHTLLNFVQYQVRRMKWHLIEIALQLWCIVNSLYGVFQV